LFVSQETAFALLGITPRKFRDLLVPLCRSSVVRIGKSALIPVDVAEGTLRALGSTKLGSSVERDQDSAETQPLDDELDSADAVLYALGRRRAG